MRREPPRAPAVFAPERESTARPARRLVGTWLLVTAAVLALPGPGHALRLGLVAAHLLLAHLLFDRPFPGRAVLAGVPVARVVADWSPLLIAPAFYWEAPLMAGVLHGPLVYDAVVQHWDAVLFGGQPSQWLSAAWPWISLSEPLHAAYLSYYALVGLPPLVLFVSGRRQGFRRVAFTIALMFVVDSALFTAFPVLGPRYLFPIPHGPLDRGLLFGFTHRVLEVGSSVGTAFPSSHVGLAAAVTVALHREAPRITPWTAILTATLAFATVYGGFHYGVDALAGAILGVTVGLAAPGIRAGIAAVTGRGARSPRAPR